MNDLRYAFRMALKNPGFSAAAVLTLALGIGLNTTIFSAVNPVLFRPLPFRDPGQLVYLNEKNAKQGFDYLSISYADYRDWKEQQTSFEDLGVYTGSTFTITGGEQAERVAGAQVSGTLFSVLGIQPIYGRSFLQNEDAPGAEPVALLSHNLWQRRYASDPKVLGASITLNGRSHTIIGVMPARFRFPDFAELWTPLVVKDPEGQRGNHSYAGVARLKRGTTLAQARAEMAAISQRLAQAHPGTNSEVSAVVMPLREQMMENMATMCWVLLGAVGFVLAVACANVANLFLARALARQKEFAVRAALGASRARAVRQLLVESLLLAGMAGVLGLLFSQWGVQLITRLIPVEIPYWIRFDLDARVLVFTVVLSGATCLLFGLVPALQATQRDVQAALRESGPGTGEGRERKRLRGVLVVAQVALVVLLLTGAGLMVRTILNLQKLSPGFNPSRLLVFQIGLPETQYGNESDRTFFFERLQERLAQLPGAQAAAAVSNLPLDGSSSGYGYTIEGFPPLPPGQNLVGNTRIVTPGYFGTMEIPLVQGRDFTSADSAPRPGVIIIDATLARQFFANENPIGRRIKFGGFESQEPWMEIIGVAGEVKHYGLDKAIRPGFYRPHTQHASSRMTVVLRTTRPDPMDLLPSTRQVVRELDPELPLFQPRSMSEVVARSLWQKRFFGQLFALFSVCALLLAVVGISGVVAYSVAQRTQEIGVRMALGAQGRDVLRLIVKDGMKLVGLGLAIGSIAALGLNRALASQLYGVAGTDPVTLTASLLLFGTAALLACYVPARRATRIDPMISLRSE